MKNIIIGIIFGIAITLGLLYYINGSFDFMVGNKSVVESGNVFDTTAVSTEPKPESDTPSEGMTSVYEHDMEETNTISEKGRQMNEQAQEWLDSIDWDDVQDDARQKGEDLAALLNGVVDSY